MPIADDKEIQKPAKAERTARCVWTYYDSQGNAIGTLGYSRKDPDLPLPVFFCGWDRAEECEVEIYDPVLSGRWRYDVYFRPDQVPMPIKRMTSKNAIRIWNWVIQYFGDETRGGYLSYNKEYAEAFQRLQTNQ